MRLRPHQLRLDVPRRVRDLFPLGRSRWALKVVAPARTTFLERLAPLGRAFRWLLCSLAAMCVFAALAMSPAIAFAIGDALAVRPRDQMVIAAAVLVAQWLVTLALVATMVTRASGWTSWARARGHRSHQFLLRPLPGMPASVGGETGRAFHAVVGARRIGVELGVSESIWGGASYVARVRLPAGTGDVLPASRFERRGRTTWVDVVRIHGARLELESEKLARQCTVQVVDGPDPLQWRRLFDPALVDLLAEGIDIEWVQHGDELILHLPAPRRARWFVDAARFDTLCVAAAALERRFATIVGNGIAAPPAAYERPEADDGEVDPAARYVARERARDLSLDPEALFAELERLTNAREVAAVRAKVDAGTFPLEWLDDLVHHRRARLWGQADAA